MSSLLKKQARSLGFATVLLSQVFMASTTVGQESDGFGAVERPNEASVEEISIQALLQDLSDHPLAGSVVNIEVCAQDGLDETDCDVIEAELPLPQLNNPLGYEIQALRRALAWSIENAPRNEDGLPLESALREIGFEVAQSFETFMNVHSVEFQKPATLIRVMDTHYDLILAAENADLAAMENIIVELRTITVQLEDDLLTDAEKALRDAQEALREALEQGASSEELAELNEQLVEAMEAYIEEQLEGEGLSPEDQQALEDMQALMEALLELLEEMGLTPEEFAQMMQNMMMGGQAQPPAAGQAPEVDIDQMIEALRAQIELMQKMQKYMQDLREIIEEQQEVRDQTLSEALREEMGTQRQEGAPTVDELEARQEALADRLEGMIEDMQNDGINTGDIGLDTAQAEMSEAETDLESRHSEDAVIDQDEALEALIGGESSMMQMMMMMPGSGNMSGNMPGGGPPNDLESGDMVVDGDGNLRSSDNPNEALGIDTQDPDNLSRGVRDEILERRRHQPESGGSDYLDRLLRGPNSP